VNPRTAALGIVGMLNWIAWWYQPGDDESAIAVELAGMAVGSVLGAAAVPASQTVHHLIGNLRLDIDRLERILGPG
jgi:hypothetical protein